MWNNINDVWNNFENVEATSSKNDYLPANLQGHMRVVQLKLIASKKNNNRPMFISTMATEEGCTLDGQPLEAGIVYDWVAKADENAYLQNIKRLVCALNPEGDPRTFGKELMEALTSDEQPAKNAIIRIRTEQIKTTKGFDFTKAHFFPAMDI